MNTAQAFKDKIENCKHSSGHCEFAYHGMCAKVDKAIRDLSGCPPNKRNRKPVSPEQIDWIGPR